MIISHKYRFIFIKTKKTAGTSIESYLSRYCGVDDVLTEISPPVARHTARNHRGLFNPMREMALGPKDAAKALGHLIKRRRYYSHMPAMTLRARLPGRIWNSYFKFCVERNPWDKTASHFYHQKHKFQDLTVEKYFSGGNFCLNHPLYCDRNQNVLVDHIIKYENLDDELTRIFKMLGIPFSGRLNERAKSNYRDHNMSYQRLFNAEQIKFIGEIFEQELKLRDRVPSVLQDGQKESPQWSPSTNC